MLKASLASLQCFSLNYNIKHTPQILYKECVALSYSSNLYSMADFTLDCMLATAQDWSSWNLYWEMFLQQQSMQTEYENGNKVCLSHSETCSQSDSLVSPCDSGTSLQPSVYFNTSSNTCPISNPYYDPYTAFREVVLKTGGTMYECTAPNCPKRFTRRAENAKSHWLRHNNQAPYVCKRCYIGFTRRSDLKRHQARCSDTLYERTKFKRI